MRQPALEGAGAPVGKVKQRRDEALQGGAQLAAE
jgi:hypothetical protein